jgi:hypothetical protein
MVKNSVKIEKVIDAEKPNEAAAKFRGFLVKSVRESPDRLLITVTDKLSGYCRRIHPKSVLPLFIFAAGLMFASLSASAHSQAFPGHTSPSGEARQSSNVPELPSEEEIGELLSKASEYVQTYQQTFTSSKSSLDKTATPGFYAKGMELSAQASSVIAAIKKKGSSAYALVGLIAILDDMSLNAARASAATTLVALEENRSDPKNHVTIDFVSLAQAEKNCYDISELLLHSTLRYIAVEETVLQTLMDRQKQGAPPLSHQ